jgi:hypothetical protein
MTKNEWKLREEIIAMSQADNFEEAKKEWILERVYKGLGVCLCGHSPILNLCVLRNTKNNQKTIVGSSCVQKFIGIKTEHLFKSYELIVKNPEAYLDLLFIEYLFKHDVINEWEYEFLKSTFRKKFEWLSEKQRTKRIQINKKVIAYMELKEEAEDDSLAQLTSGPGDLDPEWWK